MWNPGDLIVRRELLGYSPVGPPSEPRPWHGRSWLQVPVFVVTDTDEHLVTYIPTGAEFRFPTGPWPTEDGLHPWAGRDGWQGHGCLMVQRPGEHHAVWHFWHGPDRTFQHWYINMQTAFARTELGYDTQDLEVDFVVAPDGSWELKDWEVLDQRVTEGRYWPELLDWIRDYTGELSARLDAREQWWDPAWAEWSPPEDWRDARLPDLSGLSEQSVERRESRDGDR